MKPLQDLVVLDLTRVLAGPYAGMMLADFGADVIKIEAPEVGDDSRAFGPFVGKESAYFMSLNRNKRSMTLNLKNPAARALFREMVKKADIVVENYRPGTMEKFELGYDKLAEINPRIIYAACSGFGQTGPYRDKPAYDVIVQAMGGIMSITGPAGGPPVRVGASIGDIIAGLFTVIGIEMALFHREKSGKGQMIDVGMLDCQLAVLENAIARYLVSGTVPEPLGNRHPSITPFEAFTAKDGSVIVGAGNEKLFEKLCSLIGKSELSQDPRFATNALRTQNVASLKEILDSVFIKKSIDEWLEQLEAAGIPCGPINTIDKVVVNPQIIARDMIVNTNHPEAGNIKMAGIPIKLSATPGSIDRAAPLLGQHTEEILQELLGLSIQEIGKLKENKVI
ncbi:CaiB/BaiF CoA transferase family protein [Sporomusa aerivorans]|uniref:CaiB/BaiF CoA transferase family protein n=1 Tax=Sporomusa aerivorans TaxID=204936 RepID=UPI00352A514F